MFPLHLKLKNFLSYREEVGVDFSTVHIACLSGDNGSGKSALLDAITWAIWGKSRASNDRDVVSLGETEMEVVYDFALSSREYRVFRRRSFTGASARHTLEFYIREPGTEAWTPISGDSVRHTQEKIVQTLNMEYDTFVNSAFILQGRADTFTQKPPGERKKILGDILNLQEYDELARLAREDERRTRDRLSGVRDRMAVLDERLLKRAQVLDELEVTSIQLTDVGQRLDLSVQLAQSLALQLNQRQKLQQLVDAARGRRDKAQAALHKLAQALAKEQSERDRLTALVSGADDIERGFGELQRWRSEAMRLSAVLQQVQQQETLRNSAERQIDTEQAKLQRERDRHAHAHAAASERLCQLEREQERLAKLRAEATQAGDAAGKLITIRATIEQQREERSKLHAENGQLRQKMNDIQATLARLAAGDADSPVCLRPLSDPDREHVETTWRSDGTRLGDQYRSNKAQMKSLEQAITVLEDDIRQAEVADRENAARMGAIRQIEAQLAQRDGLQSELNAAHAEHERIGAILAAGDFAHAARRQAEEARAA
jgi:exonuclease SbcC